MIESSSKSEQGLLNPTVLYFIVGMTLYLGALALMIQAETSGQSSWLLRAGVALFQSCMVFFLFTPLHDATHGSASSTRWINQTILYGVWPAFLTNPHLFFRLHIHHHAYTNDPAQDPDHFTAHRSLLVRWVKSFLLMTHYHLFYLSKFVSAKRDLGHIIASLFSQAVFMSLMVFTPLTLPLFFGMGLPAFLGIGVLAFVNTSWPHHPAEDRDRMRNTVNHYVPKWMQWLCANQNLHHVHHLNPSLPWYRYPEYWRKHEAEFRAKGARVIEVLGSKTY
jgi:fatty acid desaturase